MPQSNYVTESAPIDREYLRRHAFAYADCYVPTDDATAYADHYVSSACDHDECRYPDHGPTLADWLGR